MRDRTALLCVQGHHHKPRTEFRELPTHGRAASCLRCESGYGANDYARRCAAERAHWELVQAREKLHMWQRYACRLKLRLIGGA